MGVKGRRVIRSKQLVGKVKEGKMCWNVKEETLDSILWKTGFG
jgi:hypothetical protein